MRVGVCTADAGSDYTGSTLLPVYLADLRRDTVYTRVTQNHSSSQNQITTLYAGTDAGTPFRGGYRLGVDFDWSANLGFGISASTLRSVLERLTGFTSGDFSVVRISDIEYTIEHTGAFANKYVYPFSIHNDTAVPGFISDTYWLTGELVYARLPINPWFGYAGLVPAGLVVTLLPTATVEGDYTLQVFDLSMPSSGLHIVTIPAAATASEIKTLLTADSYIGAGGADVLGGPLNESQVQIRLNSSAYFAKIQKGVGNYDLIRCDRLTSLDKANDNDWTITGAEWTY